MSETDYVLGHEAAPAIAGTNLLAETLRSLLPMLEVSGVVKASELQPK